MFNFLFPFTFFFPSVLVPAPCGRRSVNPGAELSNMIFTNQEFRLDDFGKISGGRCTAEGTVPTFSFITKHDKESMDLFIHVQTSTISYVRQESFYRKTL